MIRLSLLWLFIAAICITTWRDRFLALCGLILLSVLSQHPDMPTNIMGIPGLNPWNICFFVIVLSWFTQSHVQLPA
ncbi:MAG: O-antigen ligase domain-containing protein, partial [Phycisphaerae bacterium]